MKILISFKEMCFGIMVGKTAYTIARHGRPFEDLWEQGWEVRSAILLGPSFRILKYNK